VPFEHPEHPVTDESVHSVVGDFEHPNFEHSDFEHSKNMAQPPPRERTLREMAAPDFTYESLCIQYPDEDVPYVLKTGLIHLLPMFHGLAGEDPHKHLKEFHIVCSTMKPPEVQEDHIFLKAFPHSLEGVAKDWLYYLAPRSITSWDDLKRVFLEKISLLLGPRPSERIFQALGNSMEIAYMNTGRDLKNYAPVALTTRFMSSFFSNIFMKASVTWREV